MCSVYECQDECHTCLTPHSTCVTPSFITLVLCDICHMPHISYATVLSAVAFVFVLFYSRPFSRSLRVTLAPCHNRPLPHLSRVTLVPCHTRPLSHSSSATLVPWHTRPVLHSSSVSLVPCHTYPVSHSSCLTRPLSHLSPVSLVLFHTCPHCKEWVYGMQWLALYSLLSLSLSVCRRDDYDKKVEECTMLMERNQDLSDRFTQLKQQSSVEAQDLQRRLNDALEAEKVRGAESCVRHCLIMLM